MYSITLLYNAIILHITNMQIRNFLAARLTPVIYSKKSKWQNSVFTLSYLTSLQYFKYEYNINSLSPELNPIFYLLALLEAHHFLHVSMIRVKSLTLRLLMSYINGAPILDVPRSHTTTQHSR
jgi:hypothetical protein